MIETAQGALAQLANSPANLEQLTTVRRAFHTLKGSSRMVGLKEFGDAGWVCEQVSFWTSQHRLVIMRHRDDDLRAFAAQAGDL